MTNETPQYIYEHIISRNYGWSLEEIRGMDYYDFMAHVQVCIAHEETEHKFQARLAGADTSKKKLPDGKSIRPQTETVKEKVM